MMDDQFEQRFAGVGRVLTPAGLECLRRSHLAVVGIGGVGCWAAEALARCGVGCLTLVDLDDVCVTNTNRQLHANDGDYGRPKVDAMKDRIARISPACEVHAVAEFVTADSVERLLNPVGLDGVLDCIDGVRPKVAMILHAMQRQLPLVMVGAAGGRRDPTRVCCRDLFEATHDPLLRQVRKSLRRQSDRWNGREPGADGNRLGVPAVFSTEPAAFPEPCLPGKGGQTPASGATDGTVDPGGTAAPKRPSLRIDCESGYGTLAYVTGAFGFAAAAAMVDRVLDRREHG